MVFTFIIGIFAILAVLTLVSVFFSDEKGAMGAISAVLALIALVFFLIGSYTRVGPTDVGVPVSKAFCHSTLKDGTFVSDCVGEPIGPGIHWTKPWINVQTYPTKSDKMEDSFEIVTRTSDNGTFTIKGDVRRFVREDSANDLYTKSTRGDMNSVDKKIITPNLRQAVTDVYQQLDNSTALKDRTETGRKVKNALQTLLEPYGIGVEMVYLTSADPDKATQDALNSYNAQQAKTKLAKEQNETELALKAVAGTRAQALKLAAGSIPAMSPDQFKVYCVQQWAQAQADATAKGLTLYVNPCGATQSNLLLNAK